MSLELLPVDCIARILSYASPRDACRCSAVSSAVRWLSDSDAVWDNYLPYDFREIVTRSELPAEDFRSKKDIFMRLCRPLLIDGGTKTFCMDKTTGKKCYMLSAKQLSIAYSGNPLYWSWKSHPLSRFGEVAELRTIWWLEIQGAMTVGQLSPDTLYGAYLIVQVADRAYGLDSPPFETALEHGDFVLLGKVQLNRCCLGSKNSTGLSCQRNRPRTILRYSEGRGPVQREDGWMEVEIGAFYKNRGGDENQEVKFCLREIKGQHLKGGLIVEGLEIRPKFLC